MTKREKRLLRIQQNPNNVSIDDLEQLMLDYGIEKSRASKGSHRHYHYAVGGTTYHLVIPATKPVKKVYIQQVLEAIEEISNDQDS
ncbi:MAG: hypothetical protein LCI00_27380 [Chloroflexi bacterium]|nr:hypothetical protein [Chloroflexota bacterium]MCC6897214.1 hypothetical protein [Anaerolineae bacterium]